MDAIRILGGVALDGEIVVGGAKNAALPLMAASLLSEEPLTLVNMPELVDITTMSNLLRQHGARIDQSAYGAGRADADAGATGRTMTITADRITSVTAPYDLVRRMRASFFELGALLVRMGEAKVSLPGGCAIGTRSVDLHLKALEALGAHIDVKEGYVHASAPHGLKGAKFTFPKVTVGGTENLLMAATLADGETILENAAREPEIANLAECLKAMGADISGIGSGTLTVRGVKKLHAARVAVIPDRIETGTYAIAAAITRGRLAIKGTRYDLLESMFNALKQAGASVESIDGGVMVSAQDGLRGVDVATEPYPGFPTDLQAQWMALMATADGASMITENIFENRFMHVPELRRFGADVNIHGSSAIVRGVKQLSGAPVMATDLRASVSLVLAGLAASGETRVNRVYHLDRGYERLEQKLAGCGARIERLFDQLAAMTADTPAEDAPPARSIASIELDERSFLRRRPEVEHEREVALFDLIQENTFVLKGEGAPPAPYHLRLALSEDRLVFEICDPNAALLRQLVMPLKPFRMLIKDYFLVCENYFDAIKASSPSQIEAIDMGRRALHNEGAQMLKERLAEHVNTDRDTARRLFTLICVLHMRG